MGIISSKIDAVRKKIMARLKKGEYLWHHPLEKHHLGEFSFAVFSGVGSDNSQVEVGRDATFVGVYDGHNGSEAADFLNENVFRTLMGCARDAQNTISEDVIRRAITDAQNEFFELVKGEFRTHQFIAAVGSCCLIGVIWNNTLYVANVGDSRAVLAYKDESDRIVAHQLTEEHSPKQEAVRQEYLARFPDDKKILTETNGVLKIKGIMKVSRSFGDLYVKNPSYSIGAARPSLHDPSHPVQHPLIGSEPAIMRRPVVPADQFVIFASAGLWKLITTQEAVNFVVAHPRKEVAKELVKQALKKAPKEKNTTHPKAGSRIGEEENPERTTQSETETKKPPPLFDDITVVILFMDHQTSQTISEKSVKCWVKKSRASQFHIMRQSCQVPPPGPPPDEGARRSGSNDDVRRSGANDDVRRSRANDEATGSGSNDDVITEVTSIDG